MSIMTDEFKVRVTTALVQSNEVYKGEFKTVAELDKISAYAGDYADVYETNTRWQYTNGVWVNTGAALPENPAYATKDYVNRADEVLADAIDQEVARAQQAEANLQTAIDNTNANQANIAKSLNDEITRAKQAENALSEETATKLDKKNPVIQKSNGTPHVYFFDNDAVYECILTVKNALNVDGLIYAGANELRFNNHLSITDNLPAHNEIVKFTPDFVDFNKVITLKAGANVDIVGANDSAVVNKKYVDDNLSTVISEDMVDSLF